MRIAAVMALVASLVAGADRPKPDAAKKAKEELRGSWDATSVTFDVDGRAKDVDFFQPLTTDGKYRLPYTNFRWKIEGDRLTIIQTGELKLDGSRVLMPVERLYARRTLRVNPAREKAVDIQEGDKGRVFRAIYKLEKDTLTVAIGGSKEYPKDFNSKTHKGGLIVIEFERNKPK